MSPPWRRRHNSARDSFLAYGFQSTPPWRRRRTIYRKLAFILISIHASVKEATREYRWIFKGSCISIHASVKEATSYRKNMLPRCPFQSTPPWRRRHRLTRLARTRSRFQSTPPWRRRLQHIVIPQLSCTYLVSTTFLSTIFSFISQYVVLFFLF